jgi:regulator of RNase E activity RraA
VNLITDAEGRDAGALVDRLRALTTALVSDILDSVGFRDQVMHHGIAPLQPQATIAGRAFPMRTAVVYTKQQAHYDALFESYEHMSPGDVIVLATNADETSGIWGELLSIGAMTRGVTGIVIDGLTRDPDEMAAREFTCFARGSSPADSDGRLDVVAYAVPVRCGGVLVEPGDLILGDTMGVVCIPAKVADEVIARAEEKRSGEGEVRSELASGVSVRDVYDRYGIL